MGKLCKLDYSQSFNIEVRVLEKRGLDVSQLKYINVNPSDSRLGLEVSTRARKVKLDDGVLAERLRESGNDGAGDVARGEEDETMDYTDNGSDEPTDKEESDSNDSLASDGDFTVRASRQSRSPSTSSAPSLNSPCKRPGATLTSPASTQRTKVPSSARLYTSDQVNRARLEDIIDEADLSVKHQEKLYAVPRPGAKLLGLVDPMSVPLFSTVALMYELGEFALILLSGLPFPYSLDGCYQMQELESLPIER